MDSPIVITGPRSFNNNCINRPTYVERILSPLQRNLWKLITSCSCSTPIPPPTVGANSIHDLARLRVAQIFLAARNYSLITNRCEFVKCINNVGGWLGGHIYFWNNIRQPLVDCSEKLYAIVVVALGV
jgi:hypothetical protein